MCLCAVCVSIFTVDEVAVVGRSSHARMTIHENVSTVKIASSARKENENLLKVVVSVVLVVEFRKEKEGNATFLNSVCCAFHDILMNV